MTRCGLCNKEVSKYYLKKHMQNKHKNLQNEEEIMVDVKLPLESMVQVKEELMDFDDSNGQDGTNFGLEYVKNIKLENNDPLNTSGGSLNTSGEPFYPGWENEYDYFYEDNSDQHDNINDDDDYEPLANKKKKKTKNNKTTTTKKEPGTEDSELNPKIQKSFQCNLCDNAFSNKKRLGKHYKLDHEKDRILKAVDKLKVMKLYQCPKCEKTYITALQVKEHVMTVHEGKKHLQCEFCAETFGYRAILSRHVREYHTNSLELPCNYCGTVFQNKGELNEHVRQIHKTTLQCELCNKSFLIKKELIKHYSKDHKKKTCEICGSFYKSLNRNGLSLRYETEMQSFILAKSRQNIIIF